MEFAGSRNLDNFIQESGGRLQVALARGFFSEVAAGLAYCHEQHVAHRDMKPENVAITEDDHVKILDFGQAACIDEEREDMCGTMPFIAPEVLRQDGPYNPGFADVWSLGVLLLEMLAGRRIMPDSVGWKDGVIASAERATELEAVFAVPGALASFLAADRRWGPGYPIELLDGLLDYVPERRTPTIAAIDAPWR